MLILNADFNFDFNFKPNANFSFKFNLKKCEKILAVFCVKKHNITAKFY